MCRVATASATTASVRRVISTVRDTDTEGVMVSPARYLIQYTVLGYSLGKKYCYGSMEVI